MSETPVRFDDLRIDEHDQRVAPLGHVDHDDLLVHVDLGRGQADAGRGVHGFGHVGDELLQRLVEDGDRGGDLVQPGIGVAKDVQDGHRRGQFHLQIE